MSKGKQWKQDRDVAGIPGLSPQMQTNMKESKGVKTAAPQAVSPPPYSQLATGLTVDNEWKTVSSNKKKKSKAKQESDVKEVNKALNSLTIEDKSKTNSNKSTKKLVEIQANDESVIRNEFGQPLATEPTKRLRNLKKKLKEIEALKTKDKKSLEREQLDKLCREDEIREQIDELQRFIDNN